MSLFIDSLPPELSSTASAMVLSENFPAYNPEELVIRLEIERANLLRDQIQTQLADPNLDMDLLNELGRERICLREEILDLERRLKDIPGPFQAHANSKSTPD